MSDRLKEIFDLRERFMDQIKEKYDDSYPSWPIKNLSEKKSQVVIRETALKGVEEMFEALGHLKNWKPHRETEMPDFEREEFLEEVVDSFNYFFSLLILMGVDSNEFFDAFIKKHDIIKDRLKKGY